MRCHQMSVNGKREDITEEDMLVAGKVAGLSPKDCLAILDEVRTAVSSWTQFAATAEVKDEFVAAIKQQLHHG